LQIKINRYTYKNLNSLLKTIDRWGRRGKAVRRLLSRLIGTLTEVKAVSVLSKRQQYKSHSPPNEPNLTWDKKEEGRRWMPNMMTQLQQLTPKKKRQNMSEP
jgi:hypothetical protein